MGGFILLALMGLWIYLECTTNTILDKKKGIYDR